MKTDTAWVLLIIASLFEAGWVIGLELSDGLSKLFPVAVTGVSMLVSVGLLGLALQQLPAGTAYAVWTGLGAVVTIIVGIRYLNEPVTPVRVLFLGIIVIGMVGLQAVSKGA